MSGESEAGLSGRRSIAKSRTAPTSALCDVFLLALFRLCAVLQPCQQLPDVLHGQWPHQAADFVTVAEQDQGWPKLDAKAAAKRAAGAVLDLPVR